MLTHFCHSMLKTEHSIHPHHPSSRTLYFLSVSANHLISRFFSKTEIEMSFFDAGPHTVHVSLYGYNRLHNLRKKWVFFLFA